jgi:enamine deaminase RidA (YjgF/YER057c/UK114 family)
MSQRINYNSGSPWEDIVGYSRAVKVDNVIEISGTVAADETGTVIAKGDAYQQTTYVIQKMELALKEFGASLKDVVRTRMYVTDISLFAEFGRAHEEAFGAIRPATSMLEVKGLISMDYLIEMEATAVITEKEYVD